MCNVRCAMGIKERNPLNIHPKLSTTATVRRKQHYRERTRCNHPNWILTAPPLNILISHDPNFQHTELSRPHHWISTVQLILVRILSKTTSSMSLVSTAEETPIGDEFDTIQLRSKQPTQYKHKCFIYSNCKQSHFHDSNRYQAIFFAITKYQMLETDTHEKLTNSRVLVLYTKQDTICTEDITHKYPATQFTMLRLVLVRSDVVK